MQINNSATVSTRPKAVVPGSGLKSEPTAPGDSVQLGQTPAEPPAMTQAKALLQEAMALRQQGGQEFVTQVLPQTPPEFKAILQATEPVVQQNAQAMAQQGLVADAFFMLASETRKLGQAAVNAEARAEFREQAQQPADREAFLREEIGFQAQAEILLAAFPEQAAAASQVEVKGEQLLTARSFVDEVMKNIPADQAKQIQEAAAYSPLAQAVAANPELVKKAAASLAQTGAAMLAVTQGCGAYTGFIQQQVIPREMKAGELFQSLQPAGQ